MFQKKTAMRAVEASPFLFTQRKILCIAFAERDEGSLACGFRQSLGFLQLVRVALNSCDLSRLADGSRDQAGELTKAAAQVEHRLSGLEIKFLQA